jgi:pilus assembly protein Flp/PilA
MLKRYGDLLGRLRTDKDGVVSFEYVIVVAWVVGVVAAVFSSTGVNTIQAALTTGFAAITSAMTAAVGA